MDFTSHEINLANAHSKNLPVYTKNQLAYGIAHGGILQQLLLSGNSSKKTDRGDTKLLFSYSYSTELLQTKSLEWA